MYRLYPLVVFVILLTVIVHPSSADTLTCGAANYQVIFDPVRPSLTSYNGGSSSANNGGGGTGLNPQSTSKYTFRTLESLLPPGAQVRISNYANVPITSTYRCAT